MKRYVTYEARNGSHWPRGARGPSEGEASSPGFFQKIVRLAGTVIVLPLTLLVVGLVRAALPLLELVDRRRGR